MRIFQFENIHYPFKGQFIEIESVTHIVICRNSLGIVVYHYTPIALFTYCVQRLDSTPIEFHRGTYTVSAWSQYDNRFFVSEIFHIVGNTAISQIKVIGLSRIFGCQRVDLFYNRNNPQWFTIFTHPLHMAIFHFIFPNGSCYLEIGEPLYFRPTYQFRPGLFIAFELCDRFVESFQLLSCTNNVH